MQEFIRNIHFHMKQKLSCILTWVLVLSTAIALTLGLCQLSRTPLPWVDEILWVSSAKSVGSTGIGTPSVLLQFPKTGRFDIFYGPVPFWLGALSFRCFGLSIWSWRILSFLFGTLLVVSCGAITFRLSKNRFYAALAATFVAFAPDIGSRLTSGRMDALTVCLELAGTLFLLGSPSNKAGVFAGFLFAGAALSSPRSMPFILAFAVAAILAAILSQNIRLLSVRMLSLAVCACLVTCWTFSVGLNPISWFGFIHSASVGDRDNVSPILGGAWNYSVDVLGAAPHELVLPLSVLLCAVGVLVCWKSLAKSEDLGFTAVVVAVNFGLSLLLISRALNYQIFWLIPIVPVLLAAVQRLSPQPSSALRIIQAVLAFTLVMAVGVRAVKVAEVFRSWKSRDPQPMASFVCSKVSKNSIVYGPSRLYFYSVEGCGSTYLFYEESLSSKTAFSVN